MLVINISYYGVMFQKREIGLDLHKNIVENSRRKGEEAFVIIQGLETLDSNDTRLLHYHLILIKGR